MKTLLVILKNGLTHQTKLKMIKGRSQQVQTKKNLFFFKYELGGKIVKEFVRHRAKTYT